jgi:hypothetical protein
MMNTVKERHKSFQWIDKAEKSFNLLKKNITEQPILDFPDFSKTFQVKCDASGFAIGAVVSQDDRPIAYFSEKLNEEKVKYYFLISRVPCIRHIMHLLQNHLFQALDIGYKNYVLVQ